MVAEKKDMHACGLGIEKGVLLIWREARVDFHTLTYIFVCIYARTHVHPGGCDVAVECSHRDGETLFQRTMFFLRSGVSVVLAPEACCALQQLDVEVPSSQDSMGCWLQLQQQALACGVSIIACSDYSIAQHLLRQCLRDMAHSLIPGLHAQGSILWSLAVQWC